MTYHYSGPSRESELHALPDVEVKYVVCNNRVGEGFYAFRVPWKWGDKAIAGPFDSEAAALADARADAS